MYFIKLLKKLINYLIQFIVCIQLMIYQPLFISNAYASTSEFSEQKKTCEKDSSKQWDSSLNRCFNKQEYEDLKKGFADCAEIEDYSKRKACLDKNASHFTGDLDTGMEDDIVALQKSAEALGYTQMVIELLAKEGEKTDCWSGKINAAGGLVGLGVDVYLTFFVEDELHELQDRYSLDTTAKKMDKIGSYKAQLEAFNYLQREQEILADIDHKKTIAYGVMTGVYGLAFLLAIYEMTPWGAAGACKIYTSSGSSFDDLAKARENVRKQRADGVKASTADGSKRVAGDGKGSKWDKVRDAKDQKSVTDSFGGGKNNLDAAPKSAGAGSSVGKSGWSKVKDIQTKKSVVDDFKGGSNPLDAPTPSGGKKTSGATGDTPGSTGDKTSSTDTPGSTGDKTSSTDAPDSTPGDKTSSTDTPDSTTGKSSDSSSGSTTKVKSKDEMKDMTSKDIVSDYDSVKNNPDIPEADKQKFQDDALDEFTNRSSYEPSLGKRKEPKDMSLEDLEFERSSLHVDADKKRFTNADDLETYNSRKRWVDFYYNQKQGIQKFKNFGNKVINQGGKIIKGVRVPGKVLNTINNEEKKTKDAEEVEDSKADENDDQSYIKKDVEFYKSISRIITDPHLLEGKKESKLEDVLLLDQEWRDLLSGKLQSPSVDKYDDMVNSGLFDIKNIGPIVNVLDHVFKTYRSNADFVVNLVFPSAMADSLDTSGVKLDYDIDKGEGTDKGKNVWDKTEGADDSAYEDLKDERNKEKGKQAGIMIGAGAAAAAGGIGLSYALNYIKSPAFQHFRQFFTTSPGISVLAGMGTLVAGLNLGFVVEDKKLIESNIEKIKKIKKNFETVMEGKCVDKGDRENMSKPNCFCYTVSGKRNPKRTKSVTCKRYWAAFDSSIFKEGTDYSEGKGKQRKGCVAFDGQIDPMCKCREYKNPTGQGNACYKMKIDMSKIGPIGKALPLGTLGSAVNSITSDPGSLGDLNYSEIYRSATAIRGAGKQWLKKFNDRQKKLNRGPLDISPETLGKLASEMKNKMGGLKLVRDRADIPSKVFYSRPNKVSDDVKKSKKLKKDSEILAYKNLKKEAKEDVKKKEKEEEEGWSFEKLASNDKSEGLMEEFKDDQYEYSKSNSAQVVKKESTSIFTVISQRYIKSGLRLLFDGKYP